MYHHHHHQPTPSSAHSSMSTSSAIQGGHLEVTVVGCTKLKDTEWISKQDPYVSLQYGSTKFRTRTCTDGHKNPTFQEKFSFSLIEALREISIQVWNSNTLTMDDFIGSGKIHLQKVLSEGFDDNSWTIHTKTGRYAGEVRLIMHYANSHKPAAHYAPAAPPHAVSSTPHVPLYSAPPPYTAPYPTPVAAYSTTTTYSSYPPSSSPYPPNPYPPPPQPYAAPYSAYPPPPSSGSPYYPPGKGIYPAVYPPPPPY